MTHFQGFVKEVCQSDLVQHLACIEVCMTVENDSDCVGRCIEVTHLIHLFRERLCHLVTDTVAPTSDQCSETSLLARSFVRFQSRIILTYSTRAGYAAWRTSETWGAFLKSAAMPMLGLTLGLSGLAVAAMV